MDAVIRVENLTHTYSVGTPFEKTAINNINVDFRPGELVAVIGHTGSGKSTFMQHMNGLLAPTSGHVYCEGQDRIAIAGVIAMRPKVLILDEPTAGLDPGGCAGIIRNILDYREQTGSTVLLVTHSMDDAARIADRLVVFHEGSVAMDGTPSQVFSRPAELTAMGLDVPQAAAIAQALRERGVELPASIYTLEQLEAALAPLRKGGAD